MTYRINEIFYSIQGEGYWTGRPAVFVRFSGCNLWTGNEAERASAICKFCDTDFVDYTEYSAEQLATECEILWPGGGHPMVIFTGGEPTLQLDRPLVDLFNKLGWYTALETNGTQPNKLALDWVCVSPKTRTIHARADELKLVYPQERISPDLFENHAAILWLSPMDGPNLTANTQAALDYCLAHPQWRLNIQTHKVIGVR